jgi:hypothetical protein
MANTIYGNLPPIEDTNNTTEFFNNFYKQPTPGVSSNINDAVIGYFQSITGDRESGITLAAAVLFTAAQQGITPMEVVDQFNRVTDPGELTAYLTMFLNLNRQGTSLLGLSNQPQTNKYVTRAILP